MILFVNGWLEFGIAQLQLDFMITPRVSTQHTALLFSLPSLTNTDHPLAMRLRRSRTDSFASRCPLSRAGHRGCCLLPLSATVGYQHQHQQHAGGPIAHRALEMRIMEKALPCGSDIERHSSRRHTGLAAHATSAQHAHARTLDDVLRSEPNITAELLTCMEAVAHAGKTISSKVARAGIDGLYGMAPLSDGEASSTAGDRDAPKKLDLVAVSYGGARMRYGQVVYDPYCCMVGGTVCRKLAAAAAVA